MTVGVQVPLLQAEPRQLCPQAPQLFGSPLRLTQAPEHVVAPGTHWQARLTHCWFTAHALPQLPQLSASLVTSTQALVAEHRVVLGAVGQLGVQVVPPEQVTEPFVGRLHFTQPVPQASTSSGTQLGGEPQACCPPVHTQ